MSRGGDIELTSMTAPAEVVHVRPAFLYPVDFSSLKPGSFKRLFSEELNIELRAVSFLTGGEFKLHLHITENKGKVFEEMSVGTRWMITGHLQIDAATMTLYRVKYRGLTEDELQYYF